MWRSRRRPHHSIGRDNGVQPRSKDDISLFASLRATKASFDQVASMPATFLVLVLMIHNHQARCITHPYPPTHPFPAVTRLIPPNCYLLQANPYITLVCLRPSLTHTPTTRSFPLGQPLLPRVCRLGNSPKQAKLRYDRLRHRPSRSTLARTILPKQLSDSFFIFLTTTLSLQF